MKKAIILFLAAILITLPFAGCSGGGTTPAADAASPAAEQPDTNDATDVQTPAEPAPEGSISITHWEMVSGPATTYPDAAKSIVDKFNEENDMGVHVTLQMTPWDNFYQTFLTAVTSGAAPDTSTGASTQPTQYAAMGEILDLMPIVDAWRAESNPTVDQLPNGWVDAMTYNGILTGIPWALDPRQITYRTDYFEQAGITEMPTTWDEFLAVCEAIKTNTDAVPFVFGGADQMSTQTMLFFLIMNGAGMVDENTQADFNNPKVIEALEFASKLYENGYISEGTASYKSADAEKMYCSGTAAMWFSGPPAAVNDYPEVSEVSAIMPPMAGPSGVAQDYIWMNSIMAYSQTDEPDACRAFIKHWIENEIALWTDGHCSQVPSVSINSQDPYFQDIWYQKQISELVIPTAVPTCYPAASSFPAFSQIEGEDLIGKALQAVITGSTDFETIAADTHKAIEKALLEYGDAF